MIRSVKLSLFLKRSPEGWQIHNRNAFDDFQTQQIIIRADHEISLPRTAHSKNLSSLGSRQRVIFLDAVTNAPRSRSCVSNTTESFANGFSYLLI